MFPDIHWSGGVLNLYGPIVMLGYAAGAYWIFRQLPFITGTPGEFWAMTYTVLFFAIVGGRLGIFLVEWGRPLEPTMPVRQGWVFLPGFLMALLGGKIFQIFYNRLYRPRRYLQVADYCVPGLALGHAIGRIACLLQGCCYGAPTELPWGMRFSDPHSSISDALMGVPLHPTQLLESAFSLAVFLFLARIVLPAIRAKKLAYGTSFWSYLALYGVWRFAVEFLRGDDRGFLLSAALSPSQWLSLAMLAAALIGMWKNGVIERHPKGRTVYLK